jgi:two-component system, chemotaxis family, chemotaxis protein CheY
MDGYGKRVLVVDDDEHTRLLMGTLLEGAGYNVVAACDGLDALAEITKRHFDVVITDLNMPTLNGLELLGRIHAIHPQIPVILASGCLSEFLGTPKASQFFACLRKPFENAFFLEIVRVAAYVSDKARTEGVSAWQ